MNRITVSIDKALQKPQLLPYMRTKILEDIVFNIQNLTDDEIELYLKEHLKDETKKKGPI